ncbi:chromosomal replication initiator protein DnaA [Bacteriovoracaceae bacterium]|nr:chromosomal replication initiator protein DnaA [Bacteriovoracaceae bacterium]
MNQEFPFDRFLSGSTSKSNQPQKTNNNSDLLNSFFKNNEAPKEQNTVSNTQKECFSKNEINVIENEILNTLHGTLSTQKYNVFIANKLYVKELKTDEIILKTPTIAIKNIIESQYMAEISEAIEKTLGPGMKILFHVDNEQEKATNKAGQATNASFTLELNPTDSDLKAKVESKYINHIENSDSSITIDPNKTFDNFIVGPSNNLAFAATHAVSSSPGKEGKYPCLYIYSDSGLGKTHLLHAVANGIKEKDPKLVICLISAREFMKELINAYKDKKLDQFQKKYSDSIDVLMIDDIHELKNKQSTQEEFFHIFNELHSRGKQLIFTSDKAPQEINGIEERLITRLQWGLVIDIQKPDLETRIAILKKKANQLDLYLTDEVLVLIASSVKSSIRELEGSLIKLSATADVMNVSIDIEMAKELLKLSGIEETRKVTMESVAKATGQFYKVPLADLKSKSRNADIVSARHVAWYLSKKIVGVTYKEIAKYYARKDHSSVIHGFNKINEKIKINTKLSRDIIFIENNL